MTRSVLILTVLALLAFVNPARATELIANGGFEDPVTANVTTFGTGSTSLTSWTILQGSVEVVTQSQFASFEGTQSLDLDGVQAGTLEQSFATTPGTEYDLRFMFANNPNLLFGATIPAGADVDVFGSSALLAAHIVHGTSLTDDMQYSLFHHTFVADSTMATLRFTSTNPSASTGGIVLDAVSITPIPEPSTEALGICGLLCMGFIGLRKQSLPRTVFSGFTRVILLFAVVSFGATALPANGAPVLTGVALFSADSSGALFDDGWNTIGGDSEFNVWVSLGGSPINGPSDLGAAVSLSLAPGTYDFTIFGNPGRNRPFHGLSLFFDNDNTTPRISVFAPTASDAITTSFSPDSSSGTPNLAYTAPVLGAGTNSFSSAGLVVTLTAFRWEYSSVQAQDLVSGYSRTLNGEADNQGVFTLNVTSVPEPSSMLLAGLGAISLFGLGLSSRQRSKSALG